jgi:hypothetical protein
VVENVAVLARSLPNTQARRADDGIAYGGIGDLVAVGEPQGIAGIDRHTIGEVVRGLVTFGDVCERPKTHDRCVEERGRVIFVRNAHQTGRGFGTLQIGGV